MFEEMQKGWVCLLARRYLQGGRGVRCVRQLVLLAAIAPPPLLKDRPDFLCVRPE